MLEVNTAAAAYTPRSNLLRTINDGGVFNFVTSTMKLTCSKLLKTDYWSDWQKSEWKQLGQFEAQGMFGPPARVDTTKATFDLVWTYDVEDLDGRKKSRCTCEGSIRAGQVCVLDHTHANCVEHASLRMLYAIAAAKNLLIYGADVSNAFGEAPPPKQGIYIRPDRALRDWWVHHLKRPPLQPGEVVPCLGAFQGHLETPRLEEKHTDKILRSLKLQPTVHDPCLYAGIVGRKRVLVCR